MDAGELLGRIFLVVKLAVLIGICYYAIHDIMKKRHK